MSKPGEKAKDEIRGKFSLATKKLQQKKGSGAMEVSQKEKKKVINYKKLGLFWIVFRVVFHGKITVAI